MNKTYIFLVLNIFEPTMMGDFRPITLCNTLYEILSKILVNKIKPLIGNFISSSQNGFFPGRQILDAVITSHDVMHSMERRKNPGMAMKLDL